MGKAEKRMRRNRRRWLDFMHGVTESLTGCDATPSHGINGMLDEEFVLKHGGPLPEPGRRGPEMWEGPKEAKPWKLDEEDKIPEVAACGFTKPVPIQMTQAVYAKIRQLMLAYTDMEWMGYLQADEQGVLTELIIPEQVAGHAAVRALPHDASVKIDAVIHSHHGMGSFHSKTDDEFLKRNHPISIVVAKTPNGEITFDASRKHDLPCGSVFIRDKVHVSILSEDCQEWLASVRDRIKKPPAATVYTAAPSSRLPAHYGGGNPYGGITPS